MVNLESGKLPEIEQPITGQLFAVSENGLEALRVGETGVFFRNLGDEFPPQVGREIQVKNNGGLVKITEVEKDLKRGWKITVIKVK